MLPPRAPRRMGLWSVHTITREQGDIRTINIQTWRHVSQLSLLGFVLSSNLASSCLILSCFASSHSARPSGNWPFTIFLSKSSGRTYLLTLLLCNTTIKGRSLCRSQLSVMNESDLPINKNQDTKMNMVIYSVTLLSYHDLTDKLPFRSEPCHTFLSITYRHLLALEQPLKLCSPVICNPIPQLPKPFKRARTKKLAASERPCHRSIICTALSFRTWTCPPNAVSNTTVFCYLPIMGEKNQIGGNDPKNAFLRCGSSSIRRESISTK